MLKRYLEFINEKLKSKDFESDYKWFVNIFDEKLKNSPIADNIYSRNERSIREYVSNDDAKKIVELKLVFSNYRKEYSEIIKKISNFYDDFFTNIAQKIDADPDKDFKEMQSLMDRYGFEIETIKKLFDQRIVSLISEDFGYFISKYNLDSINGYVDIYLYYINQELNLSSEVILSGVKLRDMPDEEFLIKYAYGYHKTPYGLLFLKQNDISTEQFSYRAIDAIKPYLKEQFSYLEGKILDEIHIKVEINIDKYLMVDDDRFIFYYTELATDFNDQTKNKLSNKYTPDFFRDYLIKNCPDLRGFNFQDTSDELIITSKVDV